MMKAGFKNTLPGVPYVESPFFDFLFEKAGTDPQVLDAAQQLHRDGLAVIDFPEVDFDRIAENIKSNLSSRYDWGQWRSGVANMRLQDAWKFDADVRRLATNPEIISLLSKLYGRQAWPFQTLNFPVGTQQHVHTDSVHFSSMPERFMCGVWIALEDIGEDQGPLVYYPGSHKWPIYTNEHIGHRHGDLLTTNQTVYEEMWRGLIEADALKPVRVNIKKGQAVIWAANLLHGGDHHADKNLTRWSQVVHFYFENCVYYTPMESDPPEGVVTYREPHNILTGRSEQNHHIGNPVGEDQIKRAAPGPIKLTGFDAEAYLAANPDVARAGDDAWGHYVRHGRAEGRKLRLD